MVNEGGTLMDRTGDFKDYPLHCSEVAKNMVPRFDNYLTSLGLCNAEEREVREVMGRIFANPIFKTPISKRKLRIVFYKQPPGSVGIVDQPSKLRRLCLLLCKLLRLGK
jgi:hypothetical protein